jgi:hypothetical protein
MRRFVPVFFVSALMLALVAVPASARIDHHFSVLTKQYAQHRHGDVFTFREQLFQADNPANQVGNDRVRCRQTPSHKLRCKAVVNLNGEVGGLGSLRVNGNLGRDDNRLNVLSGTGDFVGAAGKVVPHGHSLHFDIIR